MIRDTLNQELKTAMREKNQIMTSTLRLILAAIKDMDIANRGFGKPSPAPEEEVINLLKKMIKQRRDSITMYEQGGRLELAERELDEIKIIENFLPEQLSEDAIKKAVDDSIQQTGAAGIKDMGKVMGILREKYAETMDFSVASKFIKEKLS